MTTELSMLLDQALSHIPDPRNSLPTEAFYFVSRLTPMINVDLLIKNKKGQTLLTWRHDQFYGPAWHIPGGIIRFKERIEDRVAKVAEIELGCRVRSADTPLHVRPMINTERDVRGHFISLLYLCSLESELDPLKKCQTPTPNVGDWAWHDHCPKNLLSVHESFRVFIDEIPPLEL